MNARPVCDVDVCPGIAIGSSGFCVVHQGAKQLKWVMVGQKCAACKRVLRAGEWVTRYSTLELIKHATCPRPARRRGADGEPDLFETQTITTDDVGELKL